MSKMTVEELLAKIEWEGGLFEALTSYGIKADDLEDSAPDSIKQALAKAVLKAKEADAAFESFYKTVEDEGYEAEES